MAEFDTYTDTDLHCEISELLEYKPPMGSTMKRLRDNRIIRLWAELDRRSEMTVVVYAYPVHQ